MKRRTPILPIRWKHSTKPPHEDICGLTCREIEQQEAESLLEMAGLGGNMAIVVIQVGAHRSGTIKLGDESYLHYMPKE